VKAYGNIDSGALGGRLEQLEQFVYSMNKKAISRGGQGTGLTRGMMFDQALVGKAGTAPEWAPAEAHTAMRLAGKYGG